MQRVKNPFWFDVFKHYKKISAKCTPVTFDDFVAECLHYNVNICRGKGVVCIRNWMDCGIVSLGHLVGPHGYLSYCYGAEWSKDKTQAAESIKWRPQQAYGSNQFLLVQPQTVFSTPKIITLTHR